MVTTAESTAVRPDNVFLGPLRVTDSIGHTFVTGKNVLLSTFVSTTLFMTWIFGRLVEKQYVNLWPLFLWDMGQDQA